MSTIYYYDCGVDFTKLPTSSFSLTVSRIGVTEAPTVLATDLIAALGANKCLQTCMIRSLFTYNPLSPLAYITQTAWSAYAFFYALQVAIKAKTDALSWPTYLDVTISTAGILTFTAHNGSQSFRVLHTPLRTGLRAMGRIS
jgi:hypothetical protein